MEDLESVQAELESRGETRIQQEDLYIAYPIKLFITKLLN